MSTFLVPVILFSCYLTSFLTVLFSAISGKTTHFCHNKHAPWLLCTKLAKCCGIRSLQWVYGKKFMVLLHPKVSTIDVQSRYRLSQTVLSILSLQEAVLMLIVTVFSYLFLGPKIFCIRVCFLMKSCTLGHKIRQLFFVMQQMLWFIRLYNAFLNIG